MTAIHQGLDRPAAVRRARHLNGVTIGWNVIEGIVAISAGVAAGSLSLVGFGLDSGIEVSAALVLTWRLAHEDRDGCQQQADRRAQRGIATCFAALAIYVFTVAVLDLFAGHRPDASTIGIAIAALSLVVMPILARAKRRLASDLGSRAVEAEAGQTDLCTMLSAALLVGLGANALFGWWWADSVTAVAISLAAATMAVRTWQADSLEDTCCG